jgi:hypothetical protein
MKILRMAGASIILVMVLSGGVFATISLGGQLQSIFEQLPTGVNNVSLVLRTLRDGQPNLLQKMQAAAHEIGEATSEPAEIPSTYKPSATHIVIDPPCLSWATS